MTSRRAAWNSLAGLSPTSAILVSPFGVPSLCQVWRSTASRSMSLSRPSRSRQAWMTAASNSCFTSASWSFLPPSLRSAHSQATFAFATRPEISWSLTASRASFSACIRISFRISARRASSEKVSARPCSSQGIPSSVAACTACSRLFTSLANSSSSCGSSSVCIMSTLTAMMICCPPRLPPREPSVTCRSRVSPAVAPTRPSWICGRRPLFFTSPSSNFMPSASPTSRGAPRVPSAASWKPLMLAVSKSPTAALWPSGVPMALASWRCRCSSVSCTVASCSASAMTG
mmetsp:Transcript_7964/g.20577  ORF Transcript_7964/g.20577 Transcript_7964/m.20577 type:complete len:288 (+) Transcript_7964:284-1147(+)